MSTNRSIVSISPLPYLTAVPGGASRWLCAAGIRFTALSGMVVTWAPVSTIALTLRCFRMAACIACCFLPMRSERVVDLCVRSSDFSTGFLPLDMVVSMADLVSGAASREL